MAGSQLNQLPTSTEAIGLLGSAGVPILVSPVWYKFFTSVNSLYNNANSGAGSAILDTIGSVRGGMLARFSQNWQEFVADAPNQIPIMNPGQDVDLKNISEILDLLGNLHGDVLFRGATGWEVLPPSAGGFLQSNGPGADPIYTSTVPTAASTVATGLTATGSVQSDALGLTKDWNEITDTPIGTGVLIPNSGTGRQSVVFNYGGAQLKVYPPVGGQIDSLGVDTAYSLPNSKSQVFYQIANTSWRSLQLG